MSEDAQTPLTPELYMDLFNRHKALRDEVARLRGIMEEAASAPGKDWLEWQLKLGAALTPQAGKGGGA